MSNLNEAGELSSFSAVNKVSGADLTSIIVRVENNEKRKREISDKILAIYKESKAAGCDNRALRTLVRMRKVDAQDREEQEAILDTYMIALGMI
jgi:uncharacterized protein (UPF0335 family)